MDTTHWSVVLGARDGDGETRDRALATLCESYWPPLYAYVRSRGYGPEEARDLTQDYFTRFIEDDFLDTVRQEKGKFRNFLLASLKHSLADDWRKKKAQKRGGHVVLISIDIEDAESRLSQIDLQSQTPEAIYRRSWALALLERAYGRLRTENGSMKRRERFEAVEPYISAGGDRIPYAELEKSTGVSVSALKVSVHRLRRRYGELIRDEIQQTVTNQADFDDEYEDLLSALSGR